jgi:hypothetical protein
MLYNLLYFLLILEDLVYCSSWYFTYFLSLLIIITRSLDSSLLSVVEDNFSISLDLSTCRTLLFLIDCFHPCLATPLLWLYAIQSSVVAFLCSFVALLYAQIFQLLHIHAYNILKQSFNSCYSKVFSFNATCLSRSCKNNSVLFKSIYSQSVN